MALLAVAGLQFAGQPARGQIAPASHLDGPQVAHLFGSGSQTGGKPITLRVKLNGPAPAGGAAVVLTSDEPDVIPLPATVTVPAGETEHEFTASTNPVPADIHVRVSAGYGGVTKGREVLIRDPELRSLSVQGVIRGGGQGKITVCLTGAAPLGGTTVNLAVGIQPVGVVPEILDVPATITIPAGKGCLSIAVDAAEVVSDVPLTVTASYRGVIRTANTIVRDFAGPPPPTATPTETEAPSATATETEVPTATATETATETATNTPEPTATETEVPTATATETTVSAGMVTLTKNEVGGGMNLFDWTATGFLPNASITVSGVTSSGYTYSFGYTTDAAGSYLAIGWGWPCGGAYGAIHTMTVTDGTNSDSVDQPILC